MPTLSSLPSEKTRFERRGVLEVCKKGFTSPLPLTHRAARVSSPYGAHSTAERKSSPYEVCWHERPCNEIFSCIIFRFCDGGRETERRPTKSRPSYTSGGPSVTPDRQQTKQVNRRKYRRQLQVQYLVQFLESYPPGYLGRAIHHFIDPNILDKNLRSDVTDGTIFLVASEKDCRRPVTSRVRCNTFKHSSAPTAQ